jgi:hypothetical protein
MEREFGKRMAIKENYPRNMVTWDDYSGTSWKGILHTICRLCGPR